MLEAAIEKACVKLAKQHVKVKKKVFGEQLDRWFFFKDGHVWIVEFKRPGSRLTALQEQEIKELHALGYDVEVHDDVKEFKEALEKRVSWHEGTYVKALEPSPIPERFSAVAVGPCRSGTIRGSGYRQNFHHAGRPKRS